MKKLLFLTLLLSLFFTGCKKDEADAFVNVTVKESSIPQAGVTVCMFSDQKGPSTTFFTSFFSDKKVITESSGIAKFNLEDTFDLDVIDSQTTFYFGVFGTNDVVLGSSAVTIEKGQTKSITINF
ncbi:MULTISPECIES: hypothetical protein [unclassified Lentimicrobium]|uniref:hypothetical protein n=1 Tax=unclassified Lentimicrobium TaxID=2677434 RepID=UPI0015517ECE|nr:MULTISPECIES: hypothetical protein [unclassified Lentimicrobium]NPD47227.1 hypothetical protein [Lentimicrobium sp. S6]NPD83744.1 hypothetical protein [Lentimicrobium sp. L6]